VFFSTRHWIKIQKYLHPFCCRFFSPSESSSRVRCSSPSRRLPLSLHRLLNRLSVWMQLVVLCPLPPPFLPNPFSMASLLVNFSKKRKRLSLLFFYGLGALIRCASFARRRTCAGMSPPSPRVTFLRFPFSLLLCQAFDRVDRYFFPLLLVDLTLSQCNKAGGMANPLPLPVPPELFSFFSAKH